MSDENYDFIEYTEKDKKYFYQLIKKIEKKEGKKLEREELIDKAIENEDYDFINFLIFLGEEERKEIINKMLFNKHKNLSLILSYFSLDFNYKFSEKEIEEFEKELNEYWKDGVLDLYETIGKFIEDKNFKIIIYLNQIETKKEIANIKIKLNKGCLNRMIEEEKKLKNYKDKIIKGLAYFKEVFTIEEADLLLIIRKHLLNRHELRLNRYSKEHLEKLREANAEIFYLKNTNPHDKILSTIGFVNRLTTERRKRVD